VQSGATPLYVASEKGHLEIVKVLLEKRADAEAKQKVSIYGGVGWRWFDGVHLLISHQCFAFDRIPPLSPLGCCVGVTKKANCEPHVHPERLCCCVDAQSGQIWPNDMI
jgi:ankyrin repeat protein